MNTWLTSIGSYELYNEAIEEGRDSTLVDDALPWVEYLDDDRTHALEGARIRQALERDGQCLQHPDMMLAGVARSLGVPLVSSADGFNEVDGLEGDNHREQ